MLNLLKFPVLLFFIFGSFCLSADEEILYLIKSQNWKKIEEIFQTRNPRTENEVFALIRFHEDSPSGDRNAKFRLLVSLVSGNYVSTVSQNDINEILKRPMPNQSAIVRLSYWKLYKELISRGYLNESEKILILQKMEKTDDPVSIRAFEEILNNYYEKNHFSETVKMISELKDEEKKFLYTFTTRQRYAQALAKLSKQNEAKEIYFNMLSELRTPVYVRELIIKDLRSYFGHDFHDNLNEKDLALVLDVIGKSESKKIFNRGLIDFRRKFDNPVMVRNISRLLIRYQPERLFAFLSANQDTIASNPAFSVNFAEELIQISETGIAEKIIGEFGKNSDQASVHRIYARIYKKNRQEGKYFDSLLKYLAEVPYDLGFQDKLIDFLAGSTGRGLNFSRREYWIRAMEAIPSLPVKGRLIYWYLRFLKNTGDKTALQKLLSEYYQHCPGSYYIKTIRQEFSPEISELKLPANPTSGKENLVQFLSITGARPEEMEKIRGKNLSFAYYDIAFDLGVRLSNAQSKVKNHELLQLAAEYLKVGEESNAQYLVNQYSGQKGLNEEEKQELLVGLGDITRNAYLSLFNTRLLMRKYKIPDDPLLLPQTITSRLYPRPHRSVVSKNSKSFGVEEDIVYAIMRQESFFREAAISSSNARGLMQVMPSTGKFLAKSLHVNDYSLHDPEVSIKLGTKFLSDLLQMNSNDLRWASIAYNGGPGNLRKWKRNHYQGDFNHFLEEIPSKESRDYCRITLSNYYNYRLLRSFYNQ